MPQTEPTVNFSDIKTVLSTPIPEGWEEIKSGRLRAGDRVLSVNGWKEPTRLGTNVKVLIAIRRST
jgi:hypothetical protein